MMVEEQVIVMRPAYRDPIWLNPYQKRLAKANARAASETKHLKGQVRVVAMNLLASKYLREEQD